jgi:hypothetical protein
VSPESRVFHQSVQGVNNPIFFFPCLLSIRFGTGTTRREERTFTRKWRLACLAARGCSGRLQFIDRRSEAGGPLNVSVLRTDIGSRYARWWSFFTSTESL